MPLRAATDYAWIRGTSARSLSSVAVIAPAVLWSSRRHCLRSRAHPSDTRTASPTRRSVRLSRHIREDVHMPATFNRLAFAALACLIAAPASAQLIQRKDL